MMNGLRNFLGHWLAPFGMDWVFGVGGFLLLAVVVWSVAWKGLALWKAARKGSKVWFAVFLIVNSLGILEILYLYVLSKKSKQTASPQ